MKPECKGIRAKRPQAGGLVAPRGSANMACMKRYMKLSVFLVAAILGLLSLPSRAELEVIQLRNRTAEEVLPILRPLVEPGGALPGMQYQLILRASPANIADIRRMLQTLDTRPRRLLISVRQDADRTQEARSASLSGGVQVGPGGSGAVVIGRAIDSQNSSQDRVAQTVQVMEGGIAAINVGQSIPVPNRLVTRTVNGVLVQDTTGYRDVGTGFQVLPRVSGDRVTLEINPHRDTPGSGGTVNIQQAYTTVSGRLGECMELGGSNVCETRSGSGILSGNAGQRSDSRSIWVKVEELQ